jgi:RNA-directed DNA polymerase
VGVEGVTQEPDGQHVAAHLQDRHARLKDQRSRHQPLRRVPIPQGQGKTRPRGRSACEDTRVQEAGREVLDAMYAQDCWDGSQGCRPERRAHDAVRTLQRLGDRGDGGGIVAADMVSVFDSVDRTALQKRRAGRVAEGSRRRRIGKGWPVGGLDGEA